MPRTELQCVYPSCQHTRRTRGLCHGHYQNWRSLARKGKAAPDEELMERGLLLPAGTGGAPVGPSPAFLKGSTERGCA